MNEFTGKVQKTMPFEIKFDGLSIQNKREIACEFNNFCSSIGARLSKDFDTVSLIEVSPKPFSIYMLDPSNFLLKIQLTSCQPRIQLIFTICVNF